MDGIYLSELDEELVQTDGLFSSPMDGIDTFDLVAQWDMIPIAHQLDMLQTDQGSASGVDNPIRASPEQSTLTGDNTDRHTTPVLSRSQSSGDFERREGIITGTRSGGVDQGEQLRALEDDGEMLRATYEGQYEPPPPEERTDGRMTNTQVEAFVQGLPSVVISSLGLDDLKCSICRSEYGTERGSTSGPESESEQVFTGQDLREFPVQLPCGHVFGDWCISIWLRGCRPPSCPVCRSSFQPARPIFWYHQP